MTTDDRLCRPSRAVAFKWHQWAAMGCERCGQSAVSTEIRERLAAVVAKAELREAKKVLHSKPDRG